MGTANRANKAALKSAAVLVLYAIALMPALAQSTASIQGVRFWSAGGLTRIAIETEAEVKFKYDRLVDPDRVYIDLADILPGAVKKTIAVGDGIVKQIRIGLKEKNVTRVVFDLEGKVEVSASQLSNPDRVMLELRPANGKQITFRTEPPQAVFATPSSVSDTVSKPATEPETIAAATATFRMPGTKPRAPIQPTLNLPAPPKVSTPAASLPARFALRFPPKVKSPAPYTPGRVAAVTASIPKTPEPELPQPAVRLAKPAERNSQGERSLTRALGLKLERVVLDAGHGGHDTGTIGKSGLMEKDLVLDVTLRLGKLIEEKLGSEVIYTRDDDTFIPLRRRTELANEKRADLFLSIHANSSSAKTIAGTETFFLNFTSSKEDMDVASRENAGGDQSIHDLSDLVKKIALQEKVEESREFAERIQSATHELTTSSIGRIKNRGVKKAPFVVLIGAQMPSVLSEIGFITNAKEEAMMQSPEYRQKIAEALLKGISKYADSLSHFTAQRRAE
jgi:N-acetylmuramoyl-L-alanine amidase